jgi:hypothetical protein
MSRLDVDDENKVRMENELIRQILQSDEYEDISEVVEKFGTPGVLADKMAKSDGNTLANNGTKKTRDYQRYMPQVPYGEYMREETNTNIKLLYIPLLQISSGTERIRKPIIDNCYYY